ncbi:MAG: polynucleotide adenylyltransferase PcnB [Deltaproteobacteria bacterium]|nr:polynucleotide adenylyltransferase PcnB [Deltaproteobacteria bacterium]
MHSNLPASGDVPETSLPASPRPRPPIDPALIDFDAAKVVRRLQQSGHLAYLVGGCVRDLLLGRTPKDFDVATSATPTDMKRVFRNCRIIGRRFRLAHVFFGRKIIETATFRQNPRPESEDESDLLIQRDNVFGTAEEDARRRDFTINGLFYDPSAGELIDYVGGLDDLRAGLVRTIGDPDIRMQEDPVRILRAVKFAARLGFTIEPATYAALLQHRGDIAKCAPPRVVEEIYRLLRGGAAAPSMLLLRVTGVLQVLLPDLAAALDDADPDGAAASARLQATLAALDRVARAATVPPSNAFILATLLRPFLDDVLEPNADTPDASAALVARLQPHLAEVRASRRDGERARELLELQRRFGQPPRRRSRSFALARRDLFGEALALFGLYAEAAGAVPATLDGWLFLLAGAPVVVDEAEPRPAVGADPDRIGGGSRRRRRRRGGRGRH